MTKQMNLLFIETKATSPVLPLALFRNDIVTLSNVIGFIMNAGMMGALIYLPFFVQGVEGISPTYSGYVTMPMSISMVIISMVIGRRITKTGKYKRYAVMGLPIMIGGMLIMAYMNSVWLAVVAMIVFGIGLGMGMPVFSLTVQNAVSPVQLGVATSSSQLFRNLGGTIGIAVMGTIMQTSLRTNMKDAAKEAATSGYGFDFSKLDPATAKQLAAFQNPEMLLDQPKLEKLQHTLPKDIQPVITQMIETLRNALSHSLTTVFLAGTALVVVALMLVFFLREIPLRTSNKMPQEGQQVGGVGDVAG